ncbi:MAG: hypothetical protein KAY50_00740 [Chitinophagaceae bacterium]|nr:hypothetical protein [Chitinophagaceae bacterium]
MKIYSHELISKAVVLSVAFDSEYPSICWMIPAGFHFMKFDPAVKIPDDKYWMPTTLFRLNEESLDVAVANESIWKAFLKPDFEDYDEIYQSPYLNMLNEYTNCMGTAKPDNSHFTINEIVNVWTGNFFGATFNAIPDNLNISYQDYYLKAKTKTKFNKSDYGKLSTTIGSFCR